MALALLVGCLPFAAAQEPAVYKGTVLMAVNTDRHNSFANFTTDRTHADVSVGSAAEPQEEQILLDAPLNDPQPLSPAQALLREAEVGDVTPQAAANYRVGDTKRITSHYAVSLHADFRYVDMVCTSVSEKATVWRERGTENDHIEDDRKLAAELDERLPKELEFFGDKRIDTDGDGKVAVFLYKIDGINIGGYFTVADLMDKVGRVGSVWHPYLSTSNHMDCIHVQGGNSYSFIVETCLHEYQHYIQASYRFVGRNNFNALDATETFINEGFSTSAEYLLYGVDRYTYYFADASKPSGKLAFLNWEHDHGNYSMAFVFSQYIRTRYAALTNDLDSAIPGGTIYKTILESRTPKNDGDTMAIVADILYPAAQYPDLRDSEARCSRLLTDFWTAVFCQKPEGVHGFNGESWIKRLDPRDMLEPMPAGQTEYPIRGGMAAFYQIASNETDSVAVTQSDHVLTFTVPPQTKYTLRFDANGGFGAPEAQILLDTWQFKGRYDRDIPSRSGCTFMGWALTADASSARYNAGNRIDLTQDMTLYAVWQQSPDILSDTEYKMRRQSAEYRNNYRFTPESDGIYKLTYTRRYGAKMDVLTADGEIVEPVYESETAAYYRLTRGTVYDLRLDMFDYWNAAGVFALTRQQTWFTLTYRFDHPLEKALWSCTGDTVYVVDGAGEDVLPHFLGWALTEDAQTPTVLPGSELTLTQDTTLYAVCAPETVLPTDGTETATQSYSDRYLYVLRPEQDGMYELFRQVQSSVDYGYADVLDAQGRYLMSVRPDCEVTCALRGGKTYYLCGVTDAPNEIVSCRKTSDRISTALEYFVGEKAWFGLTVHGETEYIVPDYTPVSLDGRRFIGWWDGSDELYQPGDTISVASDYIVTAQWSDETEVTVADRLLVPARALRALWQWLGLRISDARRK